MCEYLAGCLHLDTLVAAEIGLSLRTESARRGYSIQTGEEIPHTIKTEILRHVVPGPHDLLFNITSSSKDNCIEEALDRELDYPTKKPSSEVSLFQFLRRILDMVHPRRITIIFVEGAEVGWFPLQRRTTSLEEFFFTLYELRDRPGHDIAGVYEINLAFGA